VGDSGAQTLLATGVGNRADGLLDGRQGLGVFVAGGWRTPSASYDTISPATGQVLASVASASHEDVDAAVAAGRAAAGAWRAVPAAERGRMVHEVAARVRERANDLAWLDAVDSGNPLKACRFDVHQATELLEYMAGLALELKGETVPTSKGVLDFTVREPFGVVARITAFNHPLLFAAKALGAPLVAGNTVIVKPSPWTPLSATLLVELANELLPPGVIGLLTGDATVATSLARHADVRRISLTGSVEAGLAIGRAASEVAIKAVTLELGGKNPLIALADADPDAVAAAVVDGMNLTSSAGQSCGSTSRLLVHETLRGRVVDAVAARMAALRMGDPLDLETQMGPLISEAQRQKTERFVAEARASGARIVCGGERPRDDRLAEGFYYPPTLIDGVHATHPVASEEIFGPVLVVLPWKTLDEAVEVANSVRYGLTASVYTNDLAGALTLVRRLEAGYVWVNGVSHHQLGTPFGGVKDSGTGREDSLDELRSYTQLKNVNVDLPRAGGVR
jgi:acyl-CoA reductase-like NAD-dependent aldehyde dehydrogenase